MGKKILILVVVVLLLCGGAAGGWLFLLAPPAGTPGRSAAALPEPPGQFYIVKPINLPVIRSGQVSRIVTFDLVLELGKGWTRQQIEPSGVRLRDALMQELAGLTSYAWPGNAIVDLEIAKSRLLTRGNAVLGSGAVKQVLFERIFDRAV